MSRLKQPGEMPPVKTKVVYRYRIKGGAIRELTISSWRCNYRLTQKTKCSEKIIGRNTGPVQHSAQMHWARHVKGTDNNGSS